jgi:CheY-like chemotaxis protein
LARFSSSLGAFPSSISAHSKEISSKLAQFQNPSFLAGEGASLARVVQVVPPESGGGWMQGGQWMTQGKKSAVVLIAEDDREMRSLLCDELYDLGVSIREAADGDEALRAVLDTRPTLILTDLRMPAGGLDYIARLRTFAPGVPLVLITSFGDQQTKANALALGVEAYFDKPVRISELKEAVRRLLGQALDGDID